MPAFGVRRDKANDIIAGPSQINLKHRGLSVNFQPITDQYVVRE